MRHRPPTDAPLFAQLRSRATDPATSRAAARSHCRKAQTQRTQLLAAVRRTPGLTAVELARAVGVDRYAASRRLPELEADGKVEKGDARTCRVNRRSMVTWWPPGVGGAPDRRQGTPEPVGEYEDAEATFAAAGDSQNLRLREAERAKPL